MTALQTAKQTLTERQRALLKRQGENDGLKRQMAANDDAIVKAGKHLKTVQSALTLLEDVANARRNALRGALAAVITEALRVVYGPTYAVSLDYTTRANRSALDISVIKQGAGQAEVKREMGGFGHGVADTISVPMRMLVLLGCPTADRVCVLDEAYRHVDVERVELAARFLSEVAQKLKLQIVLLSHHEVMQAHADVVYRLHDDHGRTVATRGT